MTGPTPIPKTITTTKQLEQVVAGFSQDAFVAVDTEFMRETTYWPDLCLIQISGTSGDALIDPLSSEMSLQPFFNLMADKNVVKVFHAARQDIEIVHHLANVIPHPLFDTQIAAMVCGFGESVGYENLVRTLLGRTLDKTSRFTDWSRRPLTDRQLTYALSDVTHLADAYPLLDKKLKETGRSDWVAEEMAILENPATYNVIPSEAWRRLKFNARSKRARAVFAAVAAWRETAAQAQNVPRNRILKDDALREVALQHPETPESLEALRSVPRGFSRSSRAKALLEAIALGLEMPDNLIPPQAQNGKHGGDISATSEMLKMLLRIVSAEHGVAAKLIATSTDIDEIAHDSNADVPALKGWRNTLFGGKAVALKNGSLSVALDNGKPVLLDRNLS